MQCRLDCDPGYMPDLIPITTCVDGHYQPYRPEQFLCQPALALLLSAEGELEVVGEDAKCNQIMANVPIPQSSGKTLSLIDNALIVGAFSITHNNWNYIRHTDPRGSLQTNLWTESTAVGTSAPVRHLGLVFGKDLVFLGGEQGSQAILQNGRAENGEWNALKLKWTSGSNFNFFTQDACAVKVNRDEFVLLGGKDSTSGETISLVLLINMKEQSVEELGSLIFARYLHACAVTSEPVVDTSTGAYKTSVLVTGGLGHNGVGVPVADEIFDLSEKTSRSLGHSMGSARFAHRMAVLGRTVFAFGGRQHNSNSELKTIEVFNGSTETWTLHPESLFSKRTSGMAITAFPRSAVACNQGCKCGVQADARIIGGDNAKVRRNLIWTMFCINCVLRLSHILGWVSFSLVEKPT